MGFFLEHGSVIDGTGKPAFPAGVAIDGGRITALLPPGQRPEGSDVIDVSGLAVAPGFIDIHSHSDLIFTLPPERQRELLAGRIRQGITTEIVGNCGLGRYPFSTGSKASAEAMCGFLTPEGVPPVGDSVGDYLDYLSAHGVVVNMGTLVPHGPVRLMTTGLAARPATGEELNEAVRVLRASLEAGACGLSFGLIYPPGLSTPTEEIVALARSVGDARGVVTFHQRSGSPELLEASIAEIVEVGRRAEAHVHLSHEHAQGSTAHDGVKGLLAWSERARTEGINYTQDVIPYTTVQTTLLAVFPPWSLVGGVAGWLERARDAATRQRMHDELETTVPRWPPWVEGNWPTNIVRDVGYEAISIAQCAAFPDTIGSSLAELAARRHCHAFDAMTDLLLAAEGQVTVTIDGISGTTKDERPLELLLADPDRAIVSDAWDIGRGMPHPGAYGAFPRVFRRFVRERGILDVPQAVRKLTALPAEIFGLQDRGVIRPGTWADLVAVDLDQLADRSTAEEPRTFAEGVQLVIVNGTPLFRNGRMASACPGQVLRP